MNDPIIVTGGPRSGTTLTMRFLHACGMEVGTETAKNPLLEGRIRDQLFKPLLASGGFDRRAQKSLPPVGWEPAMPVVQVRQEVLDLFGGPTGEGVVWGFKVELPRKSGHCKVSPIGFSLG